MATSVSPPTYFFCPPPMGKPNPMLSKPDGADDRGRVVQRGSEYNTCVYYVMNYLRERWKASNTHERPERALEHRFSLCNKEVSKHEKSIPGVCDQLGNEDLKRVYSQITRKTFPAVRTLLESTDSEAPNEVPVSHFFDAFLSQSRADNLYDYLVDLKYSKRLEINRSLFRDLKVDPIAYLHQHFEMDPKEYYLAYGISSPDEFYHLREETQMALLEQLHHLLMAEKYELAIAPWRPDQPFTELVKSLDNYGPLYVGGHFGLPCYNTPPKKLKTLEGRDVFYWHKSDSRKSVGISGHAILLVGAEMIESKGYVYYIDPMDDSDPAHPEKQRIFIMSYDRLTSNDSICDLHGFIRNTAPPSIGFAYCKNPKS